MMNSTTRYRWSHRLAWVMAALALLPISVGAVVTTVGAGMAFADWPTSDGLGMLSYPWLQSSGHKFLEHGHRLAGMMIGIVSLVFAAWAFGADKRPIVRWFAGMILLSVIGQGVLGGFRVLLDEKHMALIHGHFAAWVFTAMCLTVLATRTIEHTLADAERPHLGLLIASGFAFVTVFVQYLLGGQLRHLDSSHAWLVHPWFAMAVVVAVLLVHFLAGRQNLPRIQTAAHLALGLVFLQAAVGLFTWGAKYGYPQWDIMAEPLSPARVALSTLHKVVGLLTFAAIGVGFVQVIAGRRQSMSRVANEAAADAAWSQAAGGVS